MWAHISIPRCYALNVGRTFTFYGKEYEVLEWGKGHTTGCALRIPPPLSYYRDLSDNYGIQPIHPGVIEDPILCAMCSYCTCRELYSEVLDDRQTSNYGI